MRAGLPKNVQALVDLVTESAPCTTRACRACDRVPKRPWMGTGSDPVSRRASPKINEVFLHVTSSPAHTHIHTHAQAHQSFLTYLP
jgi:hypothetical protein